ncbi:MAG: thioredoxin domain-containing protein [Dehalococcoidia bacterium]|nr:thioredoxin domain-containing protein [Dehalococcoidia bacterium]
MYRKVVIETLDYVLREMTDAAGGFYSTQDADSEGEEGKFFLWTQDDLLDALEDEDALIFSLSYDVSAEGNFEDKNILHLTPHLEMVAQQVEKSQAYVEAALERSKKVLFEYREGRIKPGRDEKILTGWNGLMLRSFAEAGATLDEPKYLEAAVKNAGFLLSTMWDGHELLRSYKDGQARIKGYSEDYAFLADGLLALYEATFERKWLDTAKDLADRLVEWFWDEGTPGFYDSGIQHEVLVARPKGALDNAIPSGNSVAADVLLRLSILFDNADFRQRAEAMHSTLANIMREQPMGLGRMLCSLDTYLAAVKEIALVGDPSNADTIAMLSSIRQKYLPNKVVALRRPGEEDTDDTLPLLAGKTVIDGKATAYVCHNYACNAPVTDVAGLLTQL